MIHKVKWRIFLSSRISFGFNIVVVVGLVFGNVWLLDQTQSQLLGLSCITRTPHEAIGLEESALFFSFLGL